MNTKLTTRKESNAHRAKLIPIFALTANISRCFYSKHRNRPKVVEQIIEFETRIHFPAGRMLVKESQINPEGDDFLNLRQIRAFLCVDDKLKGTSLATRIRQVSQFIGKKIGKT